MKKILSVVSVILTLAFVITACGGNKDDSTATSAPTATQTANQGNTEAQSWLETFNNK